MGDESTETKTPPEVSLDSLRSTRRGNRLGAPKRTQSLKFATRKSREEARSYLPIYEEYADQRPKTRAECGEERPCPWVGCKYNNFIDAKGQSIVFNFPDKGPEDVPPERSCALDIADRGGATLQDVAKITNLTRERIRQVQAKALSRAEQMLDKLGLVDEDQYRGDPTLAQGMSERSVFDKDEPVVEVNEEEVEEEATDESLADSDAVAFLSENPRAEFLITSRVWRIYLRTSSERAEGTRITYPKLEKEALPSIDIPLSVPVAPRHNGVMANRKKKSSPKLKRSLEDLNDRETKVLYAYTRLREQLGRVPNNQEISKVTKLSVNSVGSTRKTLIDLSLAAPSPRGKTPEVVRDKEKKKLQRKTNPVVGPHKVFERQQLPDDITQSAAAVLAAPRGPLADAANAIRNQLIINEEQREKLNAALKALGDLA